MNYFSQLNKKVISVFANYSKLNSQKKFAIIIEDKEFNPSFFDLLNLFIFEPTGHFSIDFLHNPSFNSKYS